VLLGEQPLQALFSEVDLVLVAQVEVVLDRLESEVVDELVHLLDQLGLRVLRLDDLLRLVQVGLLVHQLHLAVVDFLSLDQVQLDRSLQHVFHLHGLHEVPQDLVAQHDFGSIMNYIFREDFRVGGGGHLQHAIQFGLFRAHVKLLREASWTWTRGHVDTLSVCFIIFGLGG